MRFAPKSNFERRPSGATDWTVGPEL